MIIRAQTKAVAARRSRGLPLRVPKPLSSRTRWRSWQRRIPAGQPIGTCRHLHNVGAERGNYIVREEAVQAQSREAEIAASRSAVVAGWLYLHFGGLGRKPKKRSGFDRSGRSVRSSRLPRSTGRSPSSPAAPLLCPHAVGFRQPPLVAWPEQGSEGWLSGFP